MTDIQETEVKVKKKYEVVSVEQCDPPAGIEGGTWYHYVIKCGSSHLDGSRCGTMQQVKEHAEFFAEELNYRDQNKGKKRVPNKS